MLFKHIKLLLLLCSIRGKLLFLWSVSFIIIKTKKLMRKFMLIWLFALVPIFSYAQNLTEHLCFMSIPINGTITQFQSKLQSKGCVLDRAVSNSLNVGCRAFTGKFVDNKVNIFVFYDEKTKSVYKVKAVLSGTSEDIADQQYEKIKNLLLTKYGSTFCNYGTQTEKESFAVLVASKNLRENTDSSYSLAANGFKGEVDLYITKDDTYLRYPFLFNLHIDYIDAINSEKHQNQSLEDI